MATNTRKGKKWQVQIRTVGHKPICATFGTKSEARIFANDRETRLDRGETVAYDDMTIAGLVQALKDETDEGRLLTAAYRTSLNHIDRLLGLKSVSGLSAKDLKDFAQARREGASSLGCYPEVAEIDGVKKGRHADLCAAPATLALDLIYIKNLLETGRALFNLGSAPRGGVTLFSDLGLAVVTGQRLSLGPWVQCRKWRRRFPVSCNAG